MRTRAQIETEARQLELRGRQERTEGRQTHAGAITVFRFPESFVMLPAAGAVGLLEAHRMIRRIDVAVPAGELEYRLVEEEIVSDRDGHLLRAYAPVDLVTSDNAFDVVGAGYERIDEDRLRERIEPIAERLEREGFANSTADEVVAEVETATDGMEFLPAARLRLKADAIAFAEGRLEAGDFIARTVQRQQCYATALALSVSHAITERIDVA